ncbi:basic proline-rich protein-like [Manis pentadactyla]|uniref:basic proline-rich protein-like n=1 Tax=Manis pentadactyla TaxID=143292 RepID=UPI00255D1620|nr:basic proline-rich protein-like [Manis pentadactyla]
MLLLVAGGNLRTRGREPLWSPAAPREEPPQPGRASSRAPGDRRGGAPELPGAIARRGGRLQPARTGREGGTKALCARGNRPGVRERPARRRPMASEPRVWAPEPCSRPAPGPRPLLRARPEPPPGPLVPPPAGRCVRPAAARPHSGTHLGGDPSRASAHGHGGGDGGARSRNPFAADTAGGRSTTAKRGRYWASSTPARRPVPAALQGPPSDGKLESPQCPLAAVEPTPLFPQLQSASCCWQGAALGRSSAGAFLPPCAPAAGRRPSARPLPVPARLCGCVPRGILPRARGPVSLHPSRPAPGRARAPPPPVPHCRTAGAQCIAPAPSVGGPPPAEIKPPAPAPPVPLAETSARGKDAWPRGPPPRPPAFRSGSPPRGQVLDAERSWGPAPGEAALLAAGIRRPPRAPGPALGSVLAGGGEEGGSPAALVYEAAAVAASRDLGTARGPAGLGQGLQCWRLVGVGPLGVPWRRRQWRGWP